ncbi:FHA domain-containing protein [Synechocystis sp. PCC 7509]|uniref:FHA domain-containing protein n=1 Tax=Synechocystis sp. PCC 7509 TaxID=927677 RepID=UPI0002ABC479|nr:FHA domain-containing protein [Synechocystis sp. PCC 7509]
MIVCPNCNHSNPEGAQSCEACYTPLPTMTNCPNCAAEVQSDATFCGQCGSNLTTSSMATEVEPSIATDISSPMPDLMALEPLLQPEPLVTNNETEAMPVVTTEVSKPPVMTSPEPPSAPPPIEPIAPPFAAPEAMPMEAKLSSTTQLQQQKARMLHIQTDTLIELPPNLSVVHIGKQNDRIPPDVDVSGFPNSEIVSRVHADIRVEGDTYYIEDVGSANGTYVNNLPLPHGNRHRLRAGDRIALGKGDLVTFLFQIS